MKKVYLILLLLITYVAKSQVVINEIYGGGGNSGATYKNDFVELYNNGASSVTMTDWSLQYTSASGNSWGNNKLAFTGTIPAKGYFLIKLATGSGGTAELPTSDATGSIALSATNGKIVLCNNSTSVSVAENPTDANIIDKVGFGTATGFETAAAPAPSNTKSIQRTTTGADNNNNSTDFAVADPSPLNSTNGTGGGADTTAPTIISTMPANMATGVATSFTASVSFNEAIAKGTGTILVKKSSDSSVVKTINIDVTTVSGTTLSFPIDGLGLNTAYYIEIANGAIKDTANNSFTGIVGRSTWLFTTWATLPMGALDTAYTFNACTGAISDNFIAYSVTGIQAWECTTYGDSSTNGVQVNGYDNSAQANVPNEDWLISPAFNLSAASYPLLEFMSRTKFNGLPLALKISTDYTGVGNPAAATWATLNGQFPAQTSDVWTKSKNIDLSAYKAAKVYIAFVYSSSSEDGARWTLDNIKVRNSAAPPPAVITSNTTDINFDYVEVGNSAVKTVLITASNISTHLSLQAGVGFQISLDSAAFANYITIPAATANNVPLKIFVKFTPSIHKQAYNSELTAYTDTAKLRIAIKGNTYSTENTLEVVNWNVEWFGSTANGPKNEAQQKSNVVTVLKNIGADVYGLLEIVNEAALVDVVAQMPGYDYKIAGFASHTNPNESGAGLLSEAQKLAFVYKASVFKNVETMAVVTNGPNTSEDLSNPAYNYFASGRYPFMMKADVTLNGETKTMRFVLLHAKANTSPTTTSYNRRKNGSDTLHKVLQNLYPIDNIIIFGDINDDLDYTITDGITPNITSYSTFTADTINFGFPTLPLSLAGKKSTVSYNDVIDHVIISNELKEFYLPESAAILTDVAGLVSSYGSSTSDHYPVITRYVFDFKTAFPVTLTEFYGLAQGNTNVLVWKTSSEINNKGFNIERSADGIHFYQIGAIAGAGNSNVEKEYGWKDYAPMYGNNYYRLKQVDIDGNYTYSAIVNIRVNLPAITSGPNPAKDYVDIRIPKIVSANDAKVEVFSVSGQLVKQEQRKINTPAVLRINLQGLKQGLYFINLTIGNTIFKERIVIR